MVSLPVETRDQWDNVRATQTLLTLERAKYLNPSPYSRSKKSILFSIVPLSASPAFSAFCACKTQLPCQNCKITRRTDFGNQHESTSSFKLVRASEYLCKVYM
eukprot:8404227-Pyramimonas_sp.AAC.1